MYFHMYNVHIISISSQSLYCIDFKLTLTTYKILSTHQPAYLRSLLFPYEPMRALRLSSQQLLNLPTVTTDCLQLLSPRIWNEIPAAIRNAPTVQTFKHRLKTHLFSLTNNHQTWPNLPPGDCPRLRFGHILRHCACYKSTYYLWYVTYWPLIKH